MEHQIKIEAADGPHSREAMRDSLFLSAVVKRLSDNSERTVRVRNLSAGGMMADSAEQFTRGDAIVVTLRGVGDINGQIAWRTEDKIGVSFDAQIDPKLARKPISGAPAERPTTKRPLFIDRPSGN